MKGKPVLPPTYMYAAIAVMVALQLRVPSEEDRPIPVGSARPDTARCRAALNLSADSAFRKARTTVKPFQESAALVTDGVYRISRHPMYLGFVLILLGLAVLLGSLTPFFIVLLFAVAMDRVFIMVEERMLAEKFGQAWLIYKAKVRRWV